MMADSTRELSNDLVGPIVAEHAEKLPLFEDFAAMCKQLVERLVGTEGIRVHSVTCRAKKSDSLRDKLSRPGKHYEALTEVTDLAGVRIITFFSDDVDAIGTIIEREFTIIEDESIDKRKALDPDRFGYLSLHYVCMLADKRADLAEYAPYRPYKCEIQVRSILQHAWAEIEHDLGYKAAQGIPRHIRRRFSRLAGLLETADEDFMRIRDELAAYSSSVKKEIAEEPSEVLLDKVSLGTFIQQDATVQTIDKQIAQWLGATLSEPDDQRIERDLERLRDLGMETIEQLRAALVEREGVIIRRLEGGPTRQASHLAFNGISFFHLWQVLLVEKGGLEALVAGFEKFNIGSDDDRQEAASRVAGGIRKALGGD